MERKRSKQDNRGVTLLEVIIAVSIFSIAAIILMEGFVTSGKINKKSNLYLEATSTAQNVMEEMKAKSFENTALAFNYPLDKTYSEGGFSRFHFLEQDAWDGLINSDDGKGTMIREMLPDDAGGYVDVKTLANGGKTGDPESATILYDDEKKKYIFNPRLEDAPNSKASQYFFEMKNVTNRKETFDIKVTFDGSSDSGYKTEGEPPEKFDEGLKNDYKLPNIAKLDKATNGFLAMPKKWSQDVAMRHIITGQHAAALVQWGKDKENWEADSKNWITNDKGEWIGVIPFPEPQPKELDEDELYKHIKRTLTITLEKDETSGIVTVKSRCKLNAYGYDARATEGRYAAIPVPAPEQPSCPCNGNGYEGDEPYPGCYCTGRSEETPFYTSTSTADLKNAYIFYYPNYEVTEKLDTVEFFNNSGYPVDFYLVKTKDPNMTNMVELSIKENAYRMELKIKEEPAPEVTTEDLDKAATKLRTNLDFDMSEGEVLKRTSNAQIEHLTFTDSRNVVSTDDEAKVKLSCNGIEDRQPKDRIYKIFVGVYKQGAAKNGFPEEDLVAFLEGSKED